ncbi:hypothetical protein ACP275_12G045200 [Erythranthe tilingii]
MRRVAAIFKIGNSKDAPEIPDHLSADAKSFIRLCLQREPSARPTAAQLLSHLFVRNQITVRATNVNSLIKTALELRSSRTSNSSFEDTSRSAASRTLLSPRDNARTIASLPVSPSSSPLRNDGAAYRNFFLSPPHPSYASVGQNGHNNNNYNDHSLFPLRPNSITGADPWPKIPHFGAQMHVRSPIRTQLSGP